MDHGCGGLVVIGVNPRGNSGGHGATERPQFFDAGYRFNGQFQHIGEHLHPEPGIGRAARKANSRRRFPYLKQLVNVALCGIRHALKNRPQYMRLAMKTGLGKGMPV